MMMIDKEMCKDYQRMVKDGFRLPQDSSLMIIDSHLECLAENERLKAKIAKLEKLIPNKRIRWQ